MTVVIEMALLPPNLSHQAVTVSVSITSAVDESMVNEIQSLIKENQHILINPELYPDHDGLTLLKI